MEEFSLRHIPVSLPLPKELITIIGEIYYLLSREIPKQPSTPNQLPSLPRGQKVDL
jgi:hypothetical protein